MSTSLAQTWLLGLMLFVGALAYFFFANQSLRLDESQSLWQTGRSASEILTIVAQDVHVPLYHELLHFWRLYVGDTVEWARALSLIFYIACIPAIYLLGRFAYGKKEGLFAATLLAISPFMNWYGSEIRMYTLFTFLVILNQYFFLRVMRSGADREEHDRAWVWYALTALLGIFVHYFFWLMFICQAVFYLMRRDLFAPGSFRRFLGVALVLGVVFAPWVWWVIHQGQANQSSPVLSAPTSINFFSTFAQFVFGFQSDHLNTFVLSLWPATVLLGVLALRKTRALLPETQYFLTTVLLSSALAFAVSVAVQPVFVSRYLIFTVPSLYLLLTALLNAYPKRAASLTRFAIALLMLAALGYEMYSSSTPVKENYREAAQYLTENVHAQDVVVLSAPFTVYPVEYYYRGDAPIQTIPNWDRYAFGPIPAFSPEGMPQEVTDTTKDHQFVWLLLSYDQGYEERVRIYFDEHFERVMLKNFSDGLDLYVYKVRYDTPLAERGLQITSPATTTPKQ